MLLRFLFVNYTDMIRGMFKHYGKLEICTCSKYDQIQFVLICSLSCKSKTEKSSLKRKSRYTTG